MSDAAGSMHGDAHRVQTRTSQGYDEHARFVSDLCAEIVGWLAPHHCAGKA
jgi:hypothetical protein